MGGLLAGFARWRSRERQLSRLAQLATLHSSEAIEDGARAELGNRIRHETDDFLYGDLRRRALRVQNALLLVSGAIAVGLFLLAGELEPWWQKISVYAAAAGSAYFGVGVTGLPSTYWRMPAIFRSYNEPRERRPKRSPNNEFAIREIPVGAGDRVLVHRFRLGSEFDALEAAVGEEGFVMGIDPNLRTMLNASNYIRIRAWPNVTVRGGEARALATDESFDAIVAMRPWTNGLTGDDIAATLAAFHRLLRAGGKVLTIGPKTRPNVSNSRADEFLAAASSCFGDDGLVRVGYFGHRFSSRVLVIAKRAEGEKAPPGL
jgi:hypothetical protein